MLQVGDHVPDATVHLGPREPVTIRELVEDGPKLLFFYLFDWSSTCTNELVLLGERRAEFDEAGVEPVGISRDSPWTHIAWTQALDLNFGLLSDFNGDAVRAFGIAHDFREFKDVARRSAFLVDEDGVVRAAWQYDTDELPDVDALLAACQTLRSADRSA